MGGSISWRGRSGRRGVTRFYICKFSVSQFKVKFSAIILTSALRYFTLGDLIGGQIPICLPPILGVNGLVGLRVCDN